MRSLRAHPNGTTFQPFNFSTFSTQKYGIICGMLTSERVMTFQDVRHEALWGEEHWLVSAHNAGPSVVAAGPEKGRSLRDLAPDFPLLAKVIDARKRLSVQVHPNERTKWLVGGDAKTEMWCALSEGAAYAGLKEGVVAADVEAAVKDGRFEDLMILHKLKPGDVLFIPGGLVHTICEGTSIYEIQQSSDTTFRLYDWGRVGPDGQPRQLHVAQALNAIDYSLPPPRISDGASCEFFDFRKCRVTGDLTVDGRGWTILYARNGEFELGGARYSEGSSVLVADGQDFTITGSDAELFITKGKKR